MGFESLRVLHWPKSTPTSALPLELGDYSTLRVETCQRVVWIWSSEQSTRFQSSPLELFQGQAAYRFLLEVSTGLRSEVRGETDVFGQLKSAWSRFQEAGPESARPLQGVFQKLFEDTKEIRALFLQNVGDASYGSLARKLFRQNPSTRSEPILLVGAGQLAHAVAPWLTEHELWISNRSEAKLHELQAEILKKDPRARVRMIVGSAAEIAAWKEVPRAVICIPASGNGASSADQARIAAWKAGSEGTCDVRTLIHLGCMRSEGGEWLSLPGFRCLDDLFALQKQQNESRSSQFERAFRACEEKAKLRFIVGGSWEDLASFG